jgi:hypothetical protein
LVDGIANPYSVTQGLQQFTTQVSLNATQVMGGDLTPGDCHGVANWNYFSGSTNPGYASEVSIISLPNGQQYQFSYDPTYGTLDKITYPSGGYVSYTWGLNSQAASVAYANVFGQPYTCQFTYDKPAILHRYVSFDGTTIALQQDYCTAKLTPWITAQSLEQPMAMALVM